MRSTAPSASQLWATIPGSPQQEIAQSLSSGPYRVQPGERITIVCAQLPQEMLQAMPYTDRSDPDFIELYRYSDLDSLLELFGHLRATNPTSRVGFRPADRLSSDDYTGHWSRWAAWTGTRRRARSSSACSFRSGRSTNGNGPGGAYFEVTEADGQKVAHRPRLDESGGRKILREDVALFARAVSPFNRKRFVTICNGMYGRGTYGAVRALTDERFRDRNAEYLRETFGDSDAVLHT